MHFDDRLLRAYRSLDGLAVGDCYGNHHSHNQKKRLAEIWEWSDDTLMALSVVSNLRQFGTINQDVLAESFAQRREGRRSYGQGATRLLKQIQSGTAWKTATYEMFEGSGSYGNGSAMRVAPLGAYFAEDMERVVKEAHLSSEVTHAHPEGIAGAIAVAVAAALVVHDSTISVQRFFEGIIAHTPQSEVRESIQKALTFSAETSFYQASLELGNGRPSIAQRTVPFALWAAAQTLTDYKSAIEKTANVGGDVDTNCAIVGGIVVMQTGLEGIPIAWRERSEPLPRWAFEETL